MKIFKAKIKKMLDEIKFHSSSDDEVAHSLEDDLRETILDKISKGKISKKNCIYLAKQALKTKKLEFFRWCA